ncbi:DUF6095 family protein [Lacinutrix himadriensis]|uniref:DUF6095 family protein n=1 Tax=Lacinutrix himadriensis TaxID=641549 RepID=UPI0006E2C69F|nr:DUF6095 family protein [Lacinutrix himadriensis]
METNHTNKDVLAKGLKTMLITIVLMFLGPVLIYIAFSNEDKPLYYPLLIAGITSCACAIFFGFKGINTIMDSMFKKQ